MRRTNSCKIWFSHLPGVKHVPTCPGGTCFLPGLTENSSGLWPEGLEAWVPPPLFWPEPLNRCVLSSNIFLESKSILRSCSDHPPNLCSVHLADACSDPSASLSHLRITWSFVQVTVNLSRISSVDADSLVWKVQPSYGSALKMGLYSAQEAQRTLGGNSCW